MIMLKHPYYTKPSMESIKSLSNSNDVFTEVEKNPKIILNFQRLEIAKPFWNKNSNINWMHHAS